MVNRFYILIAILLVKNVALNNDSMQECPVHLNENGLLQAYCSNRGLPLLPSNIPANIQVLDLSDNYQLRFSPNAFRRFGHTLVHLKLSRISDVPSQRMRHLAPLDMFLALYKLEILEFTYSNLTDGEMWRFPANLRKLVLDGNHYTYIDLSTSYKLEEISANDNKLKKFPIMYQPPVYVLKYSLKNNPLDEFTINDLAPLCNLNVLELEIPQGAFLTTPPGNCRCHQIMKWTELFNILATRLACSNLTDSKCDFNFGEYIKLRELCPRPKDVHDQTQISESDTGFISAIIKKLPRQTYSNVIIGFFIASVVGFFIYKFVLPLRRNSAPKSRRRSSRSKKKKSKPIELGDEEEDDEIGHRF